MQNEIDIFLQEVRGQNVPKEDVVLEALPPQPSAGRLRPIAAPPPQSPPVQPASRGRLATVAPSVESHVGETLASHHLATNVGEGPAPLVHSDPRALGEMVALPSLGGKTAKASQSPIVNLFRDAKSVQQAILVNEILSKPKALRDS